jgi:GntR family transcriptional regulator
VTAVVRRAWVAIADQLRAGIADGRYPPGERLPSAADLMAEHHVARQTIQNAVDQLRAEGLVLSVSGRGWYVAERGTVIRLARSRLSRAERAAGRAPFLSDAAAVGFRPAVSVVVRREPAAGDVAARLAVAPGTEVVVRERVMRADGQVVQVAASHLPADVAGGTRIEEPDTGPGGTYARLGELGHEPSRFTEAVSARRSSVAEADLLQVAPGTPVLQVVRIAYDGAGRPVEATTMVLSAAQYELVYEIDAG